MDRKPLVLVVEDEKDIARFIELELAAEGYQTEVAFGVNHVGFPAFFAGHVAQRFQHLVGGHRLLVRRDQGDGFGGLRGLREGGAAKAQRQRGADGDTEVFDKLTAKADVGRSGHRASCVGGLDGELQTVLMVTLKAV